MTDRGAVRQLLVSFRPVTKRAKPAEIGGFKSNWKKVVPRNDLRKETKFDYLNMML